MTKHAFQDGLSGNLDQCWGCGCNNNYGLQIKSYWADNGKETICTWTPKYYHTAPWPDTLSGGIIASIIDCHSVSTAAMAAYQLENPSETPIVYITAALQVNYLKPVSISHPVVLQAHVKEMGNRKMIIDCVVLSQEKKCAQGEVVAVRYRPLVEP